MDPVGPDFGSRAASIAVRGAARPVLWPGAACASPSSGPSWPLFPLPPPSTGLLSVLYFLGFDLAPAPSTLPSSGWEARRKSRRKPSRIGLCARFSAMAGAALRACRPVHAKAFAMSTSTTIEERLAILRAERPTEVFSPTGTRVTERSIWRAICHSDGTLCEWPARLNNEGSNDPGSFLSSCVHERDVVFRRLISSTW